MITTRRSFLKATAGVALTGPLPALLRAATPMSAAEAAVELAHAELWRRFVDPHGIILDETNLDGSYVRPTAEECRLGKPNAVGWLTPIANGAMFTGLHLDAAILRAQHTKAEADRAKVHRLVDGLLLLSEIGGVKGFIARGPADDGQTTYPLGSNDQTGPWFYGLWRYTQSGMPDAALRQRIIAKMTEVADVLETTGWRMPAAPPFNFRGGFPGFTWDGASRLLFLTKAMHALTGDAKWHQHYMTALEEERAGGLSRRTICERGLEGRERAAAWTGSVSVACLRGLWEMETDTRLRESYAKGLTASAEFAATRFLPLASQFDNESRKPYDGDWRKLNHLWRPQRTSVEATAVSEPQRTLKNKLSPRASEEAKLMREPAFAAWIITQCPDRAVIDRHRDAVLETIVHYHVDRLHLSSFFALENTWWRMRDEG